MSHFVAGSQRLRDRVRAFTNFAQILQIQSVFDRYRIDLLLDVGANTGQFAEEMRSFYKGEILSFEPVSRTFETLQRTAAGDPGWKCYPWALGSETASRVIHVSRLSQLSSFFEFKGYCAQRFGEDALDLCEEQVSIRRLDEVLEEVVPSWRERNIFLKMDTQGFDIEVFKGLGSQIARIAALQSEVSILPLYDGMPHWTESVALYERAGFEIAGLFPVTLDSLRVVEFDCLMIRS